MKVSTMRKVDQWVGVPACAALTLWRKIAQFVRPRPVPSSIRRILFVKPAEQGATVLALPAIQQAIRRVGRENVYFLVFQENRFILDAMDVIPRENVLAISTRGIFRLVRQMLGTLWRLRRLHIDAAIDLEFFARASAVLTYLSGAPIRVGLHAFAGEGPYRGNLMTHRMHFNPHMHISQFFQVQLAAMDAEPARLPALNMATPAAIGELPPLKLAEGELEALAAKLCRESTWRQGEPLVLLNANCSDLLPLRRWPQERYVDLCRRLLDQYDDVHIAFTGAPEEAAGVEALLKEIDRPRCFSVAGKTTLRELLVLYHLARVLVTNDSGPAHFSALTPVHVIALFGPETPRLFGLRNARGHALTAELPCSPCVSVHNNRLSPCRRNVCLERITTQEVFDLVCKILETKDEQILAPSAPKSISLKQ
jgi:ADP-heptose:LPS heptosyltransferase